MSKDKMTTIFLSYARGDDEPFVRRLYDDLTAHGFKVCSTASVCRHAT